MINKGIYITITRDKIEFQNKPDLYIGDTVSTAIEPGIQNTFTVTAKNSIDQIVGYVVTTPVMIVETDLPKREVHDIFNNLNGMKARIVEKKELNDRYEFKADLRAGLLDQFSFERNKVPDEDLLGYIDDDSPEDFHDEMEEGIIAEIDIETLRMLKMFEIMVEVLMKTGHRSISFETPKGIYRMALND
jgi:hypothetical protein